MACRDGSLRHGTLLGARTDEAWARGSADAGEGCEGLRQAQQERCRRRRGNLRGGQTPNHAVRGSQVGRAAGPVDAMSEAVERLRRAISGGEQILIYGDYDVDGTTSVVILKKAIEMAGGAASFFVPHRLRDGYGMRADVGEKGAVDGIKLIASVDTGSRAPEG